MRPRKTEPAGREAVEAKEPRVFFVAKRSFVHPTAGDVAQGQRVAAGSGVLDGHEHLFEPAAAEAGGA